MEKSGPQSESRWSRLGPGLSALHLFTLASLAIAKPLYDTAARETAFFVVRSSRPVDVLSLIALLSLVIPGAMVLLMLSAGFVKRRMRLPVHYAMIALLFALYGAQFLKLFEAARGTVALFAIPAIGLTAAGLYALARPVRQIITVISPICLAFPLLFVFNSRVVEIIFPPQEAPAKSYGVKLQKKPPIVFVLLDELPVMSLLDAQGNIDEKRFPNLAAFAREAYWFRNTTTVAVSTTEAVPAMLTGIRPVKKLLPFINDHPDNLFSLLAGNYRFNVREPITSLCPEGLKQKEDELSYKDRMNSMLSDISIVYLHIVIPRNYSSKLPSIADKWGNFAARSNPKTNNKSVQANANKAIEDKFLKVVASDRLKIFEQFTQSIDENSSGTLNFIHLMMPHGPYEYLPTCKQYSSAYGNEDRIKKKDDMYTGPQGLVSQKQHLHIMQTACVDYLWGQLIEQLKNSGVYNEALIILTSDHGVSFLTNDYRRRMSLTNAARLMFTPLIIKVPNQKQGIISDFDAESIDILPTVADVLGIKIPWQVTGTSLFAPQRQMSVEKKLLDGPGIVHNFSYQKLLEDRAKAHARNIKLFGLEDDSSTHYWFGRYRKLMGKPVSDFEVVKGNYVVKMEQNKALFGNVDLAKNFLPAAINGRVVSSNGVNEPKVVVGLNGVIQAVADTYVLEDESIFYTILPENAFKQGENEIELYVLLEGDKIRLGFAEEVSFEISGDHIISSTGRKFPIIGGALEGYIDGISRKNSSLILNGWTADIKGVRLVDDVLVFADGKFLHAGETSASRPDVGKAYGKEGIEKCGFNFIISEKSIKDTRGIRMFAISGGVASEIHYPKQLMDKQEDNSIMKGIWKFFHGIRNKR